MSARDTALAASEKLIGTEVGVSNWILVDQAMIDQFAKTTHDEQWIHVDPERAAAETPFGGTIAHGFLTLSLASRFAYDCFNMLPGQVMGINYGMNKLRFLKPVLAGSRLRGRFTLQKVTSKGPVNLLRENLLTIEIEGEKTPALIAEWLGMAVFKD
ncbi:MaoC family dehydratase [Sulfitobacter guttiformis]|uniref:Acyl dehydratase n=1 Tax=Sulfitobacter guttiformis TaxID=74349 RepID=J7FW86_9RHOB|nr:MaoC family dehydratase [Sulfitobacter guttiformis]AFP55433.1 nodulation protein N [Sulfitobacter guttiformis]KIN75439.1 Nodulation protein N [Sulfitobacter guttiformis KCTC 32187]RKE92055.1 acyl dehydratase [Sulfitobacter guttiformis]